MHSRSASASTSLLALLLGVCAPALAAVTASVDQDHVAPGTSLQLTLERDGQGQENPDLAPLRQDFDILATSRGSNVQIVNGHVSAHEQLLLTLSPKHEGALQIPAITWGSGHSAPVAVTVDASAQRSPGAAATSPAAPQVFLDTQISPAQPWVQAAVAMTVRVYAGTSLYQANLSLPSSGEVIALQVGSDRNSTDTRNGHAYRVLERHYLLFPQHSGKLRLPTPVLDAQVPVARADDPFDNGLFGNFFGGAGLPGLMTSTRPVRVRAKDVELDVRPRPGTATGAAWLPATQLELGASLDPASGHARAGEPVTLNLHLQAQGLTAAQLPDLATLIQWPAGLKAYPDPPRLGNDTQGNTITGTRDQSIALVADQAGRYEVPALRVEWWDTKSGTAKVATLAPQLLDLAPAVAGATATPAPAHAPLAAPAVTTEARTGAAATAGTVASGWRWLSAALLAAWLATLALWWMMARRKGTRSRAKPPVPPPAGPAASVARAAFRAACERNDAQAARKQLQAWIAAADPALAAAGLGGLARASSDASLPGLLRQLDRACYGGGTWEGSALAGALARLPREAQAPPAPELLPPLYRQATG
jgi:hypothetical protein